MHFPDAEYKLFSTECGSNITLMQQFQQRQNFEEYTLESKQCLQNSLWVSLGAEKCISRLQKQDIK